MYYIDFSDVKLTPHAEDKLHLVMIYNSVLLDLRCSGILLRIFASKFLRNVDPWLSFFLGVFGFSVRAMLASG